MEYGNMWHVCEEAFAATPPTDSREFSDGDYQSWESALKGYARELSRQYPSDREEIDKWYNVCRMQFPLYVRHWQEHPDVLARTPLLQEEAFDVPYCLPSGRTVRLRGKWDSVDLVEKGTNQGVWLMENKTKGDIDETALQEQVSWDLQVMLYITALREATKGGKIL
jgi:hypothetical protein